MLECVPRAWEARSCGCLTTLLAGGAGLVAIAAAVPAQRAGQVPDAVLGRLGPGQCAGGAEQGLHQADRHRDEVRVRAVAELRRPHAQRAELQGPAVRPDDRRQPVDRRLGDQRSLRQAQRFLRQGGNQDERLPRCHRLRLFDLAQGLAELLGAAGHGRRAGLGLPQGLVRQARAAGRVQAEARPRPRPARDLDRAQGGGRVLPGPRDRRQEGLRRRHLHRARLGRHHHGRDGGPLLLGLPVREPGASPTRWKAS